MVVGNQVDFLGLESPPRPRTRRRWPRSESTTSIGQVIDGCFWKATLPRLQGQSTPGQTSGLGRDCRGNLDLATTFGLRVVAEGVETRPQALLLREMGYPTVQGWLTAPGLPQAELIRRFGGGAVPCRDGLDVRRASCVCRSLRCANNERAGWRYWAHVVSGVGRCPWACRLARGATRTPEHSPEALAGPCPVSTTVPEAAAQGAGHGWPEQNAGRGALTWREQPEISPSRTCWYGIVGHTGDPPG